MNMLYLLVISFYIINPSNGEIKLKDYYRTTPYATYGECVRDLENRLAQATTNVHSMKCVEKEVNINE